MKCSNCGFENDSGYKFCGRCGNQSDVNEPKVLRLKCQDCNGVMDIDEDKMIAFCPYCGSKKLIMESDVVKVEKIRSQTVLGQEQMRRDTILGAEQIKAEKAIAEKEFEIKKEKRDLKTGLIGFSILMGVCILIGIVVKLLT